MIRWRDREVAALLRGFVTAVAARFVASGVPPALNRVDLVKGTVLGRFEPDGAEDVELRLRPEERPVGDAGFGDVMLGLARDVAWVPAVGLAGEGVMHEEVHHQCLPDTERI